MIYND